MGPGSLDFSVIVRHEKSGWMWSFWCGGWVAALVAQPAVAGMIHCLLYVILSITLSIVCHLSNLSNLFYAISRINCMNYFLIYYHAVWLTIFLKSWENEYAAVLFYIGKTYEILTKNYRLGVLKIFPCVSQKQPDFE